MSEWTGARLAAGMKNLRRQRAVDEMQSEAGAAAVMPGRVSNGCVQAYLEATHNTPSMLRDLSGLPQYENFFPRARVAFDMQPNCYQQKGKPEKMRSQILVFLRILATCVAFEASSMVSR